jgi:hypothetical protein
MDSHHSENWSIKVVLLADPDLGIAFLVCCCTGSWLLWLEEELTSSPEGTSERSRSEAPVQASCPLLSIAYNHIEGSSQEERHVYRRLPGV